MSTTEQHHHQSLDAAGRFPNFHLAQFNFATARFELSDPRMGDFVDALDRINELADEMVGFVWRLQTASGNTIEIRPWPSHPLRLITLSVWQGMDDLTRYAYSGEHAKIMSRRREWFEEVTSNDPYLVLWWVPAGHIPTVTEGVEKLALLSKTGSTAKAFSFRSPFDPFGDPLLRRENKPSKP